MTFIYELDLYPLKMYVPTNQKLTFNIKAFESYRITQYIQTYTFRQTDKQTYRQMPPKLYHTVLQFCSNNW